MPWQRATVAYTTVYPFPSMFLFVEILIVSVILISAPRVHVVLVDEAAQACNSTNVVTFEASATGTTIRSHLSRSMTICRHMVGAEPAAANSARGGEILSVHQAADEEARVSGAEHSPAFVSCAAAQALSTCTS